MIGGCAEEDYCSEDDVHGWKIVRRRCADLEAEKYCVNFSQTVAQVEERGGGYLRHEKDIHLKKRS